MPHQTPAAIFHAILFSKGKYADKGCLRVQGYNTKRSGAQKQLAKKACLDYRNQTWY
jgi:hypothetical protein